MILVRIETVDGELHSPTIGIGHFVPLSVGVRNPKATDAQCSMERMRNQNVRGFGLKYSTVSGLSTTGLYVRLLSSECQSV